MSTVSEVLATFLPDRGRSTQIFDSINGSIVRHRRYSRSSNRVTAALQGFSWSLILDCSPYNVTLVGWAKDYHPLSIRRPVRFFSRGFSFRDACCLVGKIYSGRIYLPRLTDGSRLHYGNNRHIYSCLIATLAMNVQRVSSSFWQRKPAGQPN